MDRYVQRINHPLYANVFYIFLLRQYFMQIPEQLYKAAKIDGCSDWKYLWKIMIPNTISAIVTIANLKLHCKLECILMAIINHQTKIVCVF